MILICVMNYSGILVSQKTAKRGDESNLVRSLFGKKSSGDCCKSEKTDPSPGSKNLEDKMFTADSFKEYLVSGLSCGQRLLGTIKYLTWPHAG